MVWRARRFTSTMPAAVLEVAGTGDTLKRAPISRISSKALDGPEVFDS
jgi:hypothetical protein